ncbi:MarR family winged helix-turn-helix transcriptional regulator [Croceibacterium aestuarii]|uniref:MarR family winged helix-turn-helix transcriptional regulator n=1 Tax=Croceibacterium aestuarii TaxID=3064139 RepID=UPI00272E6D8A|nr:MarR family transcriptional regulator [Croceibacterium sp. D39]
MQIDGEDRLSIDDVRGRAPKMSDGPLDYGLLNDRTGFAIKLAWILGYSLLQKVFGDSGITPLRASMLELIATNPGAQQTQLANALGLSRPAATLAIDFWEARDCVERRIAPDDRRSFGIFLTAAGHERVTELRALIKQADDALVADLTAEELAELRRLLAKIHR